MNNLNNKDIRVLRKFFNQYNKSCYDGQLNDINSDLFKVVKKLMEVKK